MRAEDYVAYSSLFTTDTRWGLNLATRDSGLFTVDTRFSGSTGDVASDLFVVDTTGAVVGNASVSGRVTDTLGAGLAAASVSALQNGVVRTQVAADASGYYNLTGLPAGSYDVRATKVDHLTGIRYGVALPSGGSAACSFQLQPKPGAPPVQEVARPPEGLTLNPNAIGQLQVFSSGQFVPVSGSLDPAKMTVVLTHGWNSNPEVWAVDMADAMVSGGLIQAQVVTWDWEEQATSAMLRVKQIGDRTPAQGEALGRALSNALGSAYSKPLHFIGHSYGTLVNAGAANFLHEKTGGVFSPSRTHMTLLDEGELGYVRGNLMRMVTGSGWVSPAPRSFAWMDNYISLVGFPLVNRGVDVLLSQSPWRVPETTYILTRIQDMHRYAVDWYTLSVASPSASLLGYAQSFEQQGAAWNPVQSAPRVGSSFGQVSLASELEVAGITYAAELLGRDLMWASSGINILAAAGVNAAVETIQFTGDVLAGIADAIVPDTPVGTPVYSGTAGSTPAYYLDDSGGGIPIYSIETMLRSSGLPSLPPPPHSLAMRRLDEGSSTNPPCIWMPIAVPADAAVFSFQFTLQGEPGEDMFMASMDGTNLFALQGKYMPTNEVLDSGPIPMDEFAGREVELFFGLTGGTSSNASVTVNGMRFYFLEPPSVAIVATGSAAVVSWPASQSGYLLESAGNLAVPESWITVTNVPTLAGLQHVVTNSTLGESRFYRLRKQ